MTLHPQPQHTNPHTRHQEIPDMTTIDIDRRTSILDLARTTVAEQAESDRTYRLARLHRAFEDKLLAYVNRVSETAGLDTPAITTVDTIEGDVLVRTDHGLDYLVTWPARGGMEPTLYLLHPDTGDRAGEIMHQTSNWAFVAHMLVTHEQTTQPNPEPVVDDNPADVLAAAMSDYIRAVIASTNTEVGF